MIGIENKTESPMYLAGTMIPAGETRHFEAESLPAEYREGEPGPQSGAAPDVVPPDDVAALLAGSVRDVVAGAAALSDADVDRLIELEEAAAKPRKSLLTALAEMQLARAALRTDPGAESL